MQLGILVCLCGSVDEKDICLGGDTSSSDVDIS